MGDLMVICDHINLVGLTGLNPLVGVNDSRLVANKDIRGFVDPSKCFQVKLSIFIV